MAEIPTENDNLTTSACPVAMGQRFTDVVQETNSISIAWVPVRNANPCTYPTSA
jgi:hypothetical protein